MGDHQLLFGTAGWDIIRDIFVVATTRSTKISIPLTPWFSKYNYNVHVTHYLGPTWVRPDRDLRDVTWSRTGGPVHDQTLPWTYSENKGG